LLDLKAVCERIGVHFEPSRLGHYKSEIRRRQEGFDEYYDAESRDKVKSMFEFEFERFGYTII